MKRRKLIARKSRPKVARTPVKRVNPERKQREFARCFGSRDRVRWVKGLPCAFCAARPSDNHHTENGGMGRKGPYTNIIPVCRTCHQRLHTAHLNPTSGALADCAAMVETLWQRHLWAYSPRSTALIAETTR